MYVCASRYDDNMMNSLTTRLQDLWQTRPLQAWRSMRALMASPESTGEVFKIIEALKGNAIFQAVQRLRDDPQGSALLREKPDILPQLNDREALRAMPRGSLGRAYLRFVEARDISADGLVAASEEAPRERELDPDTRWLANRLRDIHDLQHVMCGYGPDELGELCLLAFMHAQTPNRGIGFIIFMGSRQFRREAPHIDIDSCVAEGRHTGETATWFATQRWEELLEQPLTTLREQLGVQPPAVYLAALATLAPEHLATG
jgi:ubiquinone biosynthesis protein COQ4